MSVHIVPLINQLNKHILLRDPRLNDTVGQARLNDPPERPGRAGVVGQGLAGLWFVFLFLPQSAQRYTEDKPWTKESNDYHVYRIVYVITFSPFFGIRTGNLIVVWSTFSHSWLLLVISH